MYTCTLLLFHFTQESFFILHSIVYLIPLFLKTVVFPDETLLLI